MTENDKKIIAILEEALENGSWVRMYKIANWLEKRATFEKNVSELLSTP